MIREVLSVNCRWLHTFATLSYRVPVQWGKTENHSHILKERSTVLRTCRFPLSCYSAVRKGENHLHILKERSTFFRSLKRQGESWWQGVGCRLVSYFFGMMHARPKEAIYIQWALSHLYTGGKNSPSFETPEVAVLRWRVTSTAVTWRGVFKQEGTGVQR